MSTNEYLPEAASGSDGLTASGLPPLTPDGTDATADTNSDGVEGAEATQGADPDMIADDDLDAEDPA